MERTDRLIFNADYIRCRVTVDPSRTLREMLAASRHDLQDNVGLLETAPRVAAGIVTVHFFISFTPRPLRYVAQDYQQYGLEPVDLNALTQVNIDHWLFSSDNHHGTVWMVGERLVQASFSRSRFQSRGIVEIGYADEAGRNRQQYWLAGVKTKKT